MIWILVHKEQLDANMYKRMGIADTVTSKLYNQFASTQRRPVPYAYAIDNRSGQFDHIIANLGRHGIAVDTLEQADEIAVQQFEITSIEQDDDAYEGRRMIDLTGSFTGSSMSLEGWTLIKTNNSSSMLIFQLLEPEAPDGYAAWNMLGDTLQQGSFPIVKVMNTMDLE